MRLAHARPWRASRKLQSGLSIVELMVGVAIGLVIVAAASLLMTGQLVENRRLLTETQLQQDLRATSDILTRDIRRAGALAELNSLRMIWHPDAALSFPAASFSAVTITGASNIAFSYDPGGSPSTSFRYQLDAGTIRSLVGVSGLQELTDNKVMVVDSLTFTKTNAGTPIRLPCAKLCSGATPPDDSCWPTIEVREVDVEIKAHALRASEVQRSMRTRVRLRNDILNPTACPE
ncbi:MAG: hypothetical protein Q8R98_17305 [Rubrivivax sp.]|nr:hypothetical protein [Rubrivivax sp.]MDP3613597.1 hypothetical protein [Rubrivivax sp.]